MICDEQTDEEPLSPWTADSTWTGPIRGGSARYSMSMNWKEFETARSFSAFYRDNNDSCLNSADRHRCGFQKVRILKLFRSQDVIRCDLNSHGPYDRWALDVNRADGSSA
jgi:hypothetical protein